MGIFSSLLTIGSSLLGGLFGGQKEKASSTTNTVGSQTAVTANTNLKDATATSAGTTTINSLDAATKSLLTQNVRKTLAGGASDTALLRQRNAKINGADAFNAKEYINGVMRRASSQIQTKQESDLNAISSNIGADASTNSAAALLSSRVRNDAADTLAGINSAATQNAAAISKSQTEETVGLNQAASANTAQMLGSLLQAGRTETANTKDTTKIRDKALQSQGSTSKSTEGTAATSTKKDMDAFFKTIGTAFNATY